MPEFDDDKGCSLVMVNDAKGDGFFSSLKVLRRITGYSLAVNYNPTIEQSTQNSAYKAFFWNQFDKKKNVSEAAYQSCSMRINQRILRYLWRYKHNKL